MSSTQVTLWPTATRQCYVQTRHGCFIRGYWLTWSDVFARLKESTDITLTIR